MIINDDSDVDRIFLNTGSIVSKVIEIMFNSLSLIGENNEINSEFDV